MKKRSDQLNGMKSNLANSRQYYPCIDPTSSATDAGFTLIEIIVSVSIFTVVMLITMGALLSLNDSSRKAQALRTVIDNLNFTIEDMNRKIRTGDVYHCYVSSDPENPTYSIVDSDFKISADCPGEGGGAVSLKTQELDKAGKPIWVAYLLKKDPVTGKGGLKLRTTADGASLSDDAHSESSITSSEVDIKSVKFRVVGAEDQQHSQPMVIVNIGGLIDLQKERLKTSFSLQTAISKRGIE